MTQELGILLGRRLKEIREARGLTQAQLAELSLKSVETISNFERGKTLPGLTTLELLSQRLHVQMKDFFQETDVEPHGPAHTGAARTIANALDILSDEDLDILAGVVKVLEKRRR